METLTDTAPVATRQETVLPARWSDQTGIVPRPRPSEPSNGLADRMRLMPVWGAMRSWPTRIFCRVFLAGSFERASLLLGGPVFFQAVRVATRLDLFGLLKKTPGLTVDEIASQLKLEETPARVLLMTCVALKLLKVSNGHYRCRLISKLALCKDGPRDLSSYFEFGHHILYRSFFHYFESITQCRAAGLQAFEGDEDNLYARITHNPGLEEIFHDAMQTRSERTALDLVKRVRFSRFKRILDVGGGNGSNLIAIAREYTNIKGTLLDFPTVADRAAKRFHEDRLDDRLTAEGANVFEEEFPPGHDCIMFCHFLPICKVEVNKALMRKAYNALTPGGVVCIHGPFLEDDESGPLYSAMLSPYQFGTVNGEGRHYTWKEVLGWLKDAGFGHTMKARLNHLDGAILAFK